MSGSRKAVDTLSIADAQREAAMLDRLPEDWVALVKRSRLDPGAPFEPAAIERLKKLRVEDQPTWERVRDAARGFRCRSRSLTARPARPSWAIRNASTQASRLVDVAERDCTCFTAETRRSPSLSTTGTMKRGR